MGGAVLTGCREDEELNLKDYPDATVGFEIEGADVGVSLVELTGVYDHEGALQIDGQFGRQYIFALSTPSPEDATLHIELLSENIPAEHISIDKTSVRIPAGSRTSEPVTVTLANEDFSFMRNTKEAMVYELGVKLVSYEGRNISFEGSDIAKVVLAKEAYVAGCSISSRGGNAVSFRRDYANGAILTEEPMEHKFRMQLERPADADVTISFASAGLAEQFKGDVTVTPATVTIPAGAVVSEEITWALKDDFLLTTDDSEQHEITLTASLESSDPTVCMLEEGSVLTFSIQKVRNILKVIDNLETDWTMYNRTGWTATGSGGSGTPGNVLDGNAYSDYYGTSAELFIAIDMKEARDISGVRVRYYGTSYASKAVRFEYSDDGQTWSEMGTLYDLSKTATHVFKLLANVNARYIRFTSLEKHSYYHDISEIEVYY